MKKAPAGAFFFTGSTMQLWLGLLLFAWVQSLYLLPFITWHAEVFAFGAVAFGFWALLMQRRRLHANAIELPRTVWPFFLLGLLVVVQYSVGWIGFAGDAFVLAAYICLCIAALGIGFGSCPRGHAPTNTPCSMVLPCAKLLLVAGVFSTIIAFAQVLDVWEWSGWILRMPDLRRPGGNLGQPNQLATLLLLAVASLVFLFEARRLQSVVASVLGAVLMMGLAVSESRSGVLGLGFLFVWWWGKRRTIAFRVSPRSVIAWCGFFVCCLWIWPPIFNCLQDGGWGDSFAVQINTRVGARAVVWPQLWQAVLLHPWLGWGLREVSTAHNAVLHGYSVSEPYTYAHNLFLELAVGAGLPLTLLLTGVTIVWFWRRARASTDAEAWYCVAAVIPFAVHSMFEFPYAYAYFLLPVMVLAGVLEARLAPTATIRVPWLAAAGVWTVASALMAWSVVEYIAIEEDFRIVRFEALRVGHTPSEYERPKIYLLTQLDALLEAGRLVPTPNMDAQQIELARKVALRFPWSATQNRYALSLALNGNTDEAIRQLRIMRAMHSEANYASVRDNWKTLAEDKYPQLRGIPVP